MEILRKIFKKKSKPKAKKESEEKRTYTKLKDHGTDISFENEVKKPVEKEIFENEIQRELSELRKGMKEAKK